MSTTIYSHGVREYKDFSMTFLPNEDTGNLLMKKNVQAVKQSITNLLLLKKGDKPFHPEIRSPIYKYFFDNMGVLEKIVLQGEIKEYINYYEPRVVISDVQVEVNTSSLECVLTGVLINTKEPITVNLLVDRLR